MLTHINFAFANIKDGKVIEGNEKDGEILKSLMRLKVNDSLKILISVGGWGWSGNFSDAVLTERSREIFANSGIAFMQKYKLDGIDLDWEYPGQVGAGNVFRPEDKQHFTSVLKLLRKNSIHWPRQKKSTCSRLPREEIKIIWIIPIWARPKTIWIFSIL